MPVFYKYAIITFLSYLFGAVPYGYILLRLKTGEDILKMGSGNIGSTNVRRVAGKKLSIVTQLLDMSKGLIPVTLFLILKKEGLVNFEYNLVYIIALATITGHNYSIFLKFKGGKGVNTTLGASLLIAPYPVMISVLTFFLTKAVFKYVSAGSLAIALVLPISELVIYGFTITFNYLALCSLLIIAMHYSNIRRLINGEENL